MGGEIKVKVLESIRDGKYCSIRFWKKYCHNFISKDERILYIQRIHITRLIGKWMMAEQPAFLNTNSERL